MSKDTSIPKTLAIGFSDDAVNCDKAKFLGFDTIKGYDLILLDARNFLRLEGHLQLNESGHKWIGRFIKRRVAVLHEWIKGGSVLVVHPALDFLAKSVAEDRVSYLTTSFDEAWGNYPVGVPWQIR